MNNDSSLAIRFHGAAGTVTGSCFRVEGGAKPFLVDCGMAQGPKTLQGLNRRTFPFAPEEIGAVVLTHAHIDHSGLLPRLVAEGFYGPIFATPPTCDLLQWMLRDAAAIQEMETERAATRLHRRGQGDILPPIYTRAHAEAALAQLRPVSLDKEFSPVAGVKTRFGHAGHILGAAWAAIEIAGKRLVFSGDLGPRGKTLQHDAALPPKADLLVMESTYGGRERPAEDEDSRRAKLAAEVLDAHRAGGNLLIPAFAVERTQELIHDLLLLARESRIPAMPIYLDSPLATRATEVFARYAATLEPAPDGGSHFKAPHLHVIESVAESKALARVRGGAILIAGSGMCEAGRIKHHLKDHLWRAESTVLFVGYQAPGTLGRLIRDGVDPVRIHGEELAVRARIRNLDSYSGHAGQGDLVRWAQAAIGPATQVALVHGEPDQLDALRDALAASGVDSARIAIPDLDDALVAEGKSWRLDPAKDGRDLRAAAKTGRDWHNDYAGTILAVRKALEAAPDDAARAKMLAEIRGNLSRGA